MDSVGGRAEGLKVIDERTPGFVWEGVVSIWHINMDGQ